MCGRPNCIETCSSSVPDNYGHLKLQENKAFFHETSGAASLGFRQACVAESLAFRNPNLTVNVLMTGRDLNFDSVTMKTLTSNYPNLIITEINLAEYVAGTLLERWYNCYEWNRGWFAVPHLSDALRFLTLSKYGGYYFDLDIIHLRPVSSYRNFVVPEDMGKLGSSVLHADYGHPVITMAVRDFAADYRWYVWAHNGPELITRVLQRWCDVYYISWMTPERCKGFRVVAPKTFYPLHYTEWTDYFRQKDEKAKAIFDRLMNDQSVVAAHVWNSLSAGWTVKKSTNQLYSLIARSSCPHIYQVAPEEF